MKEILRLYNIETETEEVPLKEAFRPTQGRIVDDLHLAFTVTVAPFKARGLTEEEPLSIPVKVPRVWRPVSMCIVAIVNRDIVRRALRLQGVAGEYMDIVPVPDPRRVEVVYV